MLAYIGGHNSIAVGGAPQVVHDVGRVEVARVGQILDVAHSSRTFAGVDGFEPCGAVAAGDARQQLIQHFAKIANQGHINLDVLVDLGGGHFDVNLFCLEGIGCNGSGDAIVEAHAACDEQIGFLNSVVDPCLAVDRKSTRLNSSHLGI